MGIMILLDELDYVIHGFPNNLELMMGLFNCYVREYSFVKQQQTPIKMYKLAGEERFLLWAVCSIKLQVWPPSILLLFSSLVFCCLQL
ncbi:unnamed protein product [Brassica oleracea]